MSNDISVNFKAVDSFTKPSKKISTQVRAMAASFKYASNQFASMYRTVRSFETLVAAGTVAYITKSTLGAVMEFQSLENSIGGAIGKFTDSSKELKYLRSEADRVGLVFYDMAQSYSAFAASTTRSGLSLEVTRKIFKDISETAVSMKLSPERVKLTFLALQQMASKSVVSMEELRRQLGESFPAAIEIGAKAMGMGTQAFNKMVSSGDLLARDFLPKFAEQVRKELGGSFETASTQLAANAARFKNIWFDMRVAAGEAIYPIANDVLERLKDKMSELRDSLVKNKEKIIQALSKLPGIIERLYDVIKKVAEFVIENREYIALGIVAVGTAKTITMINALSLAIKGLTLAAMANPFIAIATGIGLIGVAAVVNREKIVQGMKNIPQQRNIAGEELLTAYREYLNGKNPSQQSLDEFKKEYEKTKNKSYSYEMHGITRQEYSRTEPIPVPVETGEENLKKTKKLHEQYSKLVTDWGEKEAKGNWEKRVNLSEQFEKILEKERDAIIESKKIEYETRTKSEEALAEARIASMKEGISKEISALNLKYEREFELAKGNEEAINNLREAYMVERATAEKKDHKERMDLLRENLSITASNLEIIAGKVREFTGIYKTAAIIQIIADTWASAQSVFKNTIRAFSFMGPGAIVPATAAAGTVVGAGIVRANEVRKQRFSLGTRGFETNGPTTLLVGENPGGREKVTVQPISSQNVNGPQYGSGNYIFPIYDYSGKLIDTIRSKIRTGEADRLVRDIALRQGSFA